MFGYAIIVTGLYNLCAAFVDSVTPSALILCGHRKNESVKTVSEKKKIKGLLTAQTNPRRQIKLSAV